MARVKAFSEANHKHEARQLREVDPGLLKDIRYIWLKNPDNLTDNQRLRLAELEKRQGLKTLRAYHLKELFRHLWRYWTWTAGSGGPPTPGSSPCAPSPV